MNVRADTYLWAIRMYKSRTLAGEAIKGGKAKLNLPTGQAGDSNFKPSHFVKVGERYTLTIGKNKKIIEVVSLVEKRGTFEIAKQHYVDHSPPPEKEQQLASMFFKTNIKRAKGSGRPTKKERRDLDNIAWE